VNQKGKRRKKESVELQIQQGHERSIGKDEQLKRLINQHPQREEPKVDSVEPDETAQS